MTKEMIRIKYRKSLGVAKVAVLVILVLNMVATVLAFNYAGVEIAWTLMNKGKVRHEIVRVNKLALEGKIVSPVPLE